MVNTGLTGVGWFDRSSLIGVLPNFRAKDPGAVRSASRTSLVLIRFPASNDRGDQNHTARNNCELLD